MLNPIKLAKTLADVDKADKLLKDAQMNPSNWRTTTCGVLAIAVQLAQLWTPPKYTYIVNACTVFFTSLGLYHAADSVNLKK